MMTEELCECPKCKYDKALTHWSSGGEVNWVACPRCRTFFDHGNIMPPDEKEIEEKFWKLVEEDTGYGK